MKQHIITTNWQPQQLTLPHFSLQVMPQLYEINMTMCMSIPVFHTCDIPATYMILKKLLPSVFASKCFNDNKYTFTKEVKNTEVGHLFEHVLLEYLCMEKISRGYQTATFNGVTNWNWKEEPKGTFHITINATGEQKEIFLAALERSIRLINLILDSVHISPAVYN